ncbi:glutamate receptor 2.7-like protein [Cinnamomum micranthum f. kanehirae]|uniref:Glutamate receptor 2.7-like protein n=1 Tax=Cinnamomum micranthum f. kanehirae TaxID=337451 RepID=A0A443NA16_9MAGN|nr:glutamate receptor 2.7-like protein [Cinnamomum micranthum f. kanehirae]
MLHNDINDLIKNGDNISYQHRSYVEDLLMSLKVEESKLRAYSTPEEYALSEGTVRAIFDEIPYLRFFLAKNENYPKYRMVGHIYRTNGFGFAGIFRSESPGSIEQIPSSSSRRCEIECLEMSHIIFKVNCED